jgi:hypothetical protein
MMLLTSFQIGWHALTIGKGVGIVIDSALHALPDGQGRATRDGRRFAI